MSKKLLYSSQCVNAIKSFCDAAPNGIADYAICHNWLNQYKPLYESFELPPIFDEEQRKFYLYFSRLLELTGYAAGAAQAKRALETLPDGASADAWAPWLREFEALGKSLALFGWTSDTYLKLGSVTLALPEFDVVKRFKDVFDEHYWQ